MNAVASPHLPWVARYFGRVDYLPLTEVDVTALGVVGEIGHYQDDEYLFREGEPSDAAYIVRAGEVELSMGDRQRVVARLGRGYTLGDIEVFLVRPYIMDARAVGEVTALCLSKDRIIGELVEHPRITINWLAAALQQLERCYARVSQLHRRTVVARLADFLEDETAESGEVTMSHQEMADLLAVTRPALSQAVSKLVKAGAIESWRRRIVILDRPVLSSFIED